MTLQEAVAFIRGTQGRIFACEFVKRTTGELRLMLCRTGVTSHLKGTGARYDAAEKNLITVFDMQKQAYRCIPVEGIVRIEVQGTWHEVQPIETIVGPGTSQF